MRLTLTKAERATAAHDPEQFKRSVERFLDRSAEEVAREMRSAAPKAFSTLAQSIHVMREGELIRLVAPGVNYARAVEEGTGPAAGKARYFPNPNALAPWLQMRAGIRLTKTKPGTPGRRAQQDELRDRAFGLARYIHAHGTRAQPFVAPTEAKMQSRVMALLRQGVREGLAGIVPPPASA
jgi:Bacteriophage HK97-gp10, putative tail-component